jgi:hypothetical protein
VIKFFDDEQAFQREVEEGSKSGAQPAQSVTNARILFEVVLWFVNVGFITARPVTVQPLHVSVCHGPITK